MQVPPPRRYLCARYLIKKLVLVYTPYSPPQPLARRDGNPAFWHFHQNLPGNFVQKKFPTPPFRGAGGKVQPKQALH